MNIWRGMALGLLVALTPAAIVAQALETPPDPVAIQRAAVVRDAVEDGDLLAVGLYDIGSTTQPSNQTVATFQAQLVSGQGNLLGVATLAPLYDLATTSVDLSGTPDGWGSGIFSAYKPASIDATGSGDVSIKLQGDAEVYSDSESNPNSVTATQYQVLREEQFAEYIRGMLLVLEQDWTDTDLIDDDGNLTTLAQQYLDFAIPGWRAAGGGSGLISSRQMGAGDSGETIPPSVWTEQIRTEYRTIGGASGQESAGITEETGIPEDIWLLGLLLIGSVILIGSARLQAMGVGGDGLAAARTAASVIAVVGVAVGFYAGLLSHVTTGVIVTFTAGAALLGFWRKLPSSQGNFAAYFVALSIIAFAVDALILGNPVLTDTLQIKAINTSVLGWRVPIVGEVLGFAGFGFNMFKELLLRVPVWNYSYLPFDNPVTAFIRILVSVPTTVGLAWVVWQVFSGVIGGGLRRG